MRETGGVRVAGNGRKQAQNFFERKALAGVQEEKEEEAYEKEEEEEKKLNTEQLERIVESEIVQEVKYLSRVQFRVPDIIEL